MGIAIAILIVIVGLPLFGAIAFLVAAQTSTGTGEI